MTTKQIAVLVAGIVVGVLIAWGYSAAHAATPVTTGMEVIGSQHVGIYTLYKVLDHDNGVVCYVMAGVSCLQHE